MPTTGMEPITVPGAFDGWVTLLETHGTMKLADLMAPAIGYAENGFPVMEKIAADWEPESSEAQTERGGRIRPTSSTAARRSRARSSFRRTWRARSARWRKAGAMRSIAARSRGRSWTTARRTAAFSRWRTSLLRSPTGSSRSRRPIAATRFTSSRRTTRA